MESRTREERAQEILEETLAVLRASKEGLPAAVARAAGHIIESYGKGGKLLVFGNGGSASDALHLQGELTNRFLFDRKGLPCLALVAGAALITAIANDSSYDEVFSRQVETLARPEDVVIGISTSGRSPNVLRGIQAGKEARAFTIALTGKGPNELASLVDLALCAPSTSTPRIQEVHISLIHILCELIERELFPAP
jgi:D-sedoheptulose 7-phosphate isomerase